MQVHNRNWAQCHTKSKVMRCQYHHVLDANERSRGQRQNTPFYMELSHFLTKDRDTNTLHTYRTMVGQADLLKETPSRGGGNVGSSRAAGKLGDQELVIRGQRARAKLLELAFE